MPFLSSISNILTTLLPKSEQKDDIDTVDNKALANGWSDIQSNPLKKLAQFTLLLSMSNLASAKPIYNKALYFFANGTNYRLRYPHDADSQGFIDAAQDLMNGACGANTTFPMNYDDNACKAWQVIVRGARAVEDHSATAADLCPAMKQTLDELFLKCISPMLDAAAAALQNTYDQKKDDESQKQVIGLIAGVGGCVVGIAGITALFYFINRYLQQRHPVLAEDTATHVNTEEGESLISDVKISYHTDSLNNINAPAYRS